MRLYEYRDSKQIFNAIKSGQIKFSDARNKQNEFLNKLNEVKIGKKTSEKKGVIINTARSYLPTEEVINFYNDYVEMWSNAITMLKKMRLRQKDLKY